MYRRASATDVHILSVFRDMQPVPDDDAYTGDTSLNCGKCGEALLNDPPMTHLNMDIDEAKWMQYHSDTWFEADRAPKHAYPNDMSNIWNGVWVVVSPRGPGGPLGCPSEGFWCSPSAPPPQPAQGIPKTHRNHAQTIPRPLQTHR